MPWQFFLGISIVGEVLGRLVQRVAMKEDKSDPVAYAIVFQLIAGILLGVYAFFIGFKIPNVLPILPNLLAMPILYAAGNIFIFMSLKKMEASVFTILFATRTLWIVLGAILFLGESFSPRQSLGGILILASVIFLSWQNSRVSLQKSYLLALLGAVTFGLAIINDSFIIQSFPVAPYTALSFLAPSILLLAVFPKKTGSVLTLLQIKNIKKAALLGLLYGITYITYLTAYKIGDNAAQIGAIFPVSTVLVVIAAIIFLRERKGIMLKLVAVVLSFVGVLLVG